MQADEPPLDLRHVFAQPWEGEGSLWRPWWLRWLPAPTTFGFRSEIANETGDSWDVIDTTTFPNGSTEQRRMRATRLARDRLSLAADDMPRGAHVHVGSDGFEFDPYVIRVPVLGPLRIPVRHFDSVRLIAATEMIDTIDLRVLGIQVGRVTMHLRRMAPLPGRE